MRTASDNCERIPSHLWLWSHRQDQRKAPANPHERRASVPLVHRLRKRLCRSHGGHGMFMSEPTLERRSSARSTAAACRPAMKPMTRICAWALNATAAHRKSLCPGRPPRLAPSGPGSDHSLCQPRSKPPLSSAGSNSLCTAATVRGLSPPLAIWGIYGYVMWTTILRMLDSINELKAAQIGKQSS
jgi:hypothetical protein